MQDVFANPLLGKRPGIDAEVRGNQAHLPIVALEGSQTHILEVEVLRELARLAYSCLYLSGLRSFLQVVFFCHPGSLAGGCPPSNFNDAHRTMPRSGFVQPTR